MRFFIVLLSMYSTVTFAAVDNFNSLIAETTHQEKRLHRKLLQTIQNTQYSIAYNDQIEKLQAHERAQKLEVPVTLIKYTE
ncbi:hypothetical protein AZI86_09635 [Bdellovibrio bacteriovorus]|uniref:Uncharacterized protein n=1 Tax=Bdellovibrio bacteriovorus TaxID=959 RepID=A0A150WS95_BDEBC|nr:hypothetical protein [Bdellovibrio bacteriovorus]KYG67256.1 hypothetical protein AZI86_09635 [Bdellovibrio bacteriovorus]